MSNYIIVVRSNSVSLKYKKFTPSGGKNIRIKNLSLWQDHCSQDTKRKAEFKPVKFSIRIKVIYQGGQDLGAGRGIYKHNFCPNSFYSCQGQ